MDKIKIVLKSAFDVDKKEDFSYKLPDTFCFWFNSNADADAFRLLKRFSEIVRKLRVNMFEQN